MYSSSSFEAINGGTVSRWVEKTMRGASPVVTPATAARMTVSPRAVPAPPPGWSTIFSDDFNGGAGSPPSGNWQYDTGPGSSFGTGEISKSFSFKNYYETMAFVNAVAWVANQQDHHPDMEVGYNKCTVRYSTHSVGGLSENDFISAARIDALMK